MTVYLVNFPGPVTMCCELVVMSAVICQHLSFGKEVKVSPFSISVKCGLTQARYKTEWETRIRELDGSFFQIALLM